MFQNCAASAEYHLELLYDLLKQKVDADSVNYESGASVQSVTYCKRCILRVEKNARSFDSPEDDIKSLSIFLKKHRMIL